ncbi:MAG: glycosyltransferase family 4 protein [Hyphomicrobium sp.]
MRVLIATDAWHPQVNGVVRTYSRLTREADALGVQLIFLTPDQFRWVHCPGYPEIHLALPNRRRAARAIDAARPDFIHIATEGPVGWMARAYCLRHGRAFTTSYHTKFPEYAAALLSIPPAWAYGPVSRFHASSAGIMVATPSLAADLAERGFERLMPWTRGVETDLFRPQPVRLFGEEKPVFLYAGRVSKEKNIEAFLDAEFSGRKVVVGDGPHLASLERRYPDVIFTGVMAGEDLARCYASADVFVFPSRTDTFGLVLLEAMACGLPVAAYPVTGPIDVVEHGVSGFLSEDLATAATEALKLDPRDARARALRFTWGEAARLFIDNVRTANAAWSAAASEHAGARAEGRTDGRAIPRSIQGVPTS